MISYYLLNNILCIVRSKKLLAIARTLKVNCDGENKDIKRFRNN